MVFMFFHGFLNHLMYEIEMISSAEVRFDDVSFTLVFEVSEDDGFWMFSSNNVVQK